MPKYGAVRLYYYVAIGVFGQAVKRGNARYLSERTIPPSRRDSAYSPVR
jgi:hypothetical protein